MEKVRICNEATKRAIDFQRDLMPDAPSAQVYGEVVRRLTDVVIQSWPYEGAEAAVEQLRDTIVRVGALRVIAEKINPSGTTKVFESL